MVIVDRENLNFLDCILKTQKNSLQVMYILTDSPEVRMHYRYSSRIYPVKANIRSLLRHDIVDEILWCMSSVPSDTAEEIIKVCRQFGVSLLVPDHLDFPSLEVERRRFVCNFRLNVMETTPRNKFMYKLKTLWETSFAAMALLFMSPFLIMIAAAIKLTSKGPVIFKQLRVGLRGRKFYIYKFRTMVSNAELLKHELIRQNEADGPAFKIKNDPRITSIGKVLRKTGMDELPQLFNVIVGDMSLIGPRPLVPNEASAHEEWHLKRMSVKPGITCTWQIRPERNKVPFEEWMKLDREYVENWSALRDVKIFFGTVKSFFEARGV
jgi:lipopolysaccharide/colanic/teichoic acid biosynthesis glycosyltransferase